MVDLHWETIITNWEPALHTTATLLLEQGVELVVIKELLGHAHIGVTATVYAHVRIRLQKEAMTVLGGALDRL